MREKLIMFPYGQYIVGIYVSLAFRRYSQIRGRCWVLRDICKNVTVVTRKMDVPLHGAAVWRHGDDHACQLIFGAHCLSPASFEQHCTVAGESARFLVA